MGLLGVPDSCTGQRGSFQPFFTRLNSLAGRPGIDSDLRDAGRDQGAQNLGERVRLGSFAAFLDGGYTQSIRGLGELQANGFRVNSRDPNDLHAPHDLQRFQRFDGPTGPPRGLRQMEVNVKQSSNSGIVLSTLSTLNHILHL